MSKVDPNTDPSEGLLNFLFGEDEAEASSLALRLSQHGVRVPMMFGAKTAVSQRGDDEKRNTVQIELALCALSRVGEHFDRLLSQTKKRLTRARSLRLWASIITLVLSSSVVLALLRDSPNTTLGLVMGSLTTVGSILTLLAGRLEGSGSKLAATLTKASVLQSQAISLQDRMRAYGENPGLFRDVEKRLSEAFGLVVKLQELAAELETA